MLIGFKVGDVMSLCIELEKKQVKFYKKLAVEPFVKHAIIEDPDGHFISLAEWLQKRNLCRYHVIMWTIKSIILYILTWLFILSSQ